MMDLFANNFVAVDFETATAKRMICQIGLAVVENGEIVNVISEYVQPPNNYYESNLIRVHHIRPHITVESPTFDIIWNKLKPYIENNVVVSHSPFDENALRKNLQYYELSEDNIPHFIDTAKIFGKNYNLEDLCIGLGIPVENHHDAAADAVMCAKAYLLYLSGATPDNKLIAKYKQLNGSGSSVPHVMDMEHFEDQHIKFYKMENVICNKEVYLGDGMRPRIDCLYQILGNLGAFVNKELTNEVEVCLLSNKNFENLKSERDDTTIQVIQQFYDKQPGPPYIFDFEFLTEQELLDYVDWRCKEIDDDVTRVLYEIYMGNELQ